jgi:hypothetical protein
MNVTCSTQYTLFVVAQHAAPLQRSPTSRDYCQLQVGERA